MQRLLPLLLFLFALLVRLALVAVTEFDGLYGQDSFAYFYYALSLREAVGAGELPPPFFWPLGYPALVALATLLTGPQPFAAQLVSLLTGAAVTPLVYLIVVECHSYCVVRSAYEDLTTHYAPRTTTVGAVIAGLLTAVAAQLTLYSLVAMSDAVGLFWATLSAWLLLRYLTRWQTRWLVVTAVTLTLAIMTRWVYGLLVVPWAIAGLLAAREVGLSWQRIVSAGAVALVIGLVGVGSQLVTGLGGELAHTGDLQVVGWHPANAIKSSVENADGFFDYGRATGLYYLRPLFHPAYIFPLFTPFILLALLALRDGPRSRAALLIGWPLTVYLFLAGIAWQNWRFPLALFAPLPILVGLGLDWSWARLAERWRPLLLGYCALALLGSSLWAVRDVGNFTAWANQNRHYAQAIGQQLPPDATLLAFGLTATVQHYTALDTRELFSLTESDLQAIVAEYPAEETSVYLLVDPDTVQTQWADRSPGDNFAWLQTHTRLTAVAHYGPFVLYRVEP
jgi:4-amino-4-deoxy-L-arabinose transferase-like glycosyltransferase